MKFNKPGGYLKTIILLLIIQRHQCLRQNAANRSGTRKTAAKYIIP
jgi:hypothetical protein